MLAIETYSWTPHLETSGEACIKKVRSGKAAGFVFIDVDNSDNEIPPRVEMVGGRRMRRVAALELLISRHGVALFRASALDQAGLDAAEAFAGKSPRDMDELSVLTYQGAALGSGVASSPISRIRDPELDLIEHAARMRSYLQLDLVILK